MNKLMSERLQRGDCPKCGEHIGTMTACEQFHKCKNAQPDRLSVEQITRIADNDFSHFGVIDSAVIAAKQLLDTMRENERLHNAIGNLNPIKDFDWHGKWRIQSVIEASQRNKELDNG